MITLVTVLCWGAALTAAAAARQPLGVPPAAGARVREAVGCTRRERTHPLYPWACDRYAALPPAPYPCEFCEYLRRPRPVPLEPVPLTPLIYSATGLVNQDEVRARWRNQTRLADQVPVGRAERRVYIDLGARNVSGSLQQFLEFYPRASLFERKAWEVVPKFAATFVGHPEIEFHPEAAWIADTTLKFSNPEMAYAIPDPRYARQHGQLRGGSFRVRAIDLSRYLNATYRLDDFVVVKMDIEGAEFHILPRLVEKGTIHLIDELYLECHCYEANFLPTLRSYHWDDCVRVYKTLRRLGVFVHEWIY